MQYSPKLKKAMEEVRAIYKKYDIGGFTVLHTPGHAEWLMEVTPSYSACTIDPVKGMIAIKGMAKHYRSKEERDQRIADTLNMLNLIATRSFGVLKNVMDLSERADKIYGADHSRGDGSNNVEQSN